MKDKAGDHDRIAAPSHELRAHDAENTASCKKETFNSGKSFFSDGFTKNLADSDENPGHADQFLTPRQILRESNRRTVHPAEEAQFDACPNKKHNHSRINQDIALTHLSYYQLFTRSEYCYCLRRFLSVFMKSSNSHRRLPV